MSDNQVHDPLNFMRNLWGNMGFTLPGMVAPTFDIEELDKRIKDMKAVEGWLRMNLSMLQMTIQGLEMQRTTVDLRYRPWAKWPPIPPNRCHRVQKNRLLRSTRKKRIFRGRHVALANDAADARADAAKCRSRDQAADEEAAAAKPGGRRSKK
jgi:hypothetical protein